jgi:Tfp pilus assembly protein PilN
MSKFNTKSKTSVKDKKEQQRFFMYAGIVTLVLLVIIYMVYNS